MTTTGTTLTLGKATREAYGEALLEVGTENKNIIVIDADLAKSTFSWTFGKVFPERFFNIGIQEANMVGIASGLASCGKIPFISSFAAFILCKGFDQLRMGAAYPKLNVKVAGSHGGISIGEDGVSQQSVEDVALACALPGFIVQFGDPQSKDLSKRDLWGRGAAAASGRPVGVSEITAKRSHVMGAVGMAHMGDPAKADSQIYITLARRPDLNGTYAVFGQVITGDDVPARLQVGDLIVRMYVKE